MCERAAGEMRSGSMAARNESKAQKATSGPEHDGTLLLVRIRRKGLDLLDLLVLDLLDGE